MMFVRTAASSGGNAELDAMLARISQLEGVIDCGGNGGGEDGGDVGVGRWRRCGKELAVLTSEGGGVVCR